MSHLDDLFAGYPEKLSIDQLAQVLGVQRLTAYRYLQNGVIPGYKVGRSWLILRDEVRDQVATSSNVAFGCDKDRSDIHRQQGKPCSGTAAGR